MRFILGVVAIVWGGTAFVTSVALLALTGFAPSTELAMLCAALIITSIASWILLALALRSP
jgi:hypothetical protein